MTVGFIHKVSYQFKFRTVAAVYGILGNLIPNENIPLCGILLDLHYVWTDRQTDSYDIFFFQKTHSPSSVLASYSFDSTAKARFAYQSLIAGFQACSKLSWLKTLEPCDEKRDQLSIFEENEFCTQSESDGHAKNGAKKQS